MKRRAVDQLHPESDSFTYEEGVSSGEESEASTSDRKVFKAERKGKVLESEAVEQSSSFLTLLAALKDPEVEKKTEERLKKIEEVKEIVTPRRVLPCEQKEFEEIGKIECKIRIGDKNLSKGTVQVMKFVTNTKILMVFRNCIQKVLFSGLVFKHSKMTVMEKGCKEKHEGKTDLGLTLLQQPELKFCKILICAADAETQRLSTILGPIINPPMPNS